jgi:hypothetical protein
VRSVSQEDTDLLSKFRCSTGAAYEDDVDEFIRNRLLYWTFAPGAALDDPRSLLLTDEADPSRLVAVVAHERLTDLLLRGEPLDGTKAQVVAVSLDCRGIRIAGRRVGDLAFEALRNDARTRTPQRGRVLAAAVDKANEASLRLCDRQGLSLTVHRTGDTIWRVGEL